VVNPSEPLAFLVDLEQVPIPVIVSAVGGINTAKITGTAMPGSKIKLELAGLITEVTASYHAGGAWEANFSGVSSGKHRVFARSTDPFGTFADSKDASKELESEGVIVEPLAVTTPSPESEVEKKVIIRGVATPDRGPVLIQLGGGAVVESKVMTANSWGEVIFSPIHGPEVPLKVWLPTTGEEVSYTLNVKPFGSLLVTTCLRTRDRRIDFSRVAYHIEGTLNYEDDVHYRGVGADGVLATRESDDSWSYFGFPEDPELFIDTMVIEGKSYPAVKLYLPSDDRGELYPVLGAAPTLTSPLVIGTSAELYGLVGGETDVVSVFVPGRERQIVQGGLPDGEGREWVLKLDDLPPGPLQIELSASPDESADHRFERVTYKLEVVALQPPTYLRATQQVSVTYPSQAAEHTVQVVWEGVKTRRTNFQAVVEGTPNLFVIDRLWVTENIGKTVRVNYSVKLNSSGEEFMVSEVLEVKF